MTLNDLLRKYARESNHIIKTLRKHPKKDGLPCVYVRIIFGRKNYSPFPIIFLYSILTVVTLPFEIWFLGKFQNFKNFLFSFSFLIYWSIFTSISHLYCNTVPFSIWLTILLQLKRVIDITLLAFTCSKSKNEKTRTISEIYSKLIIITPDKNIISHHLMEFQRHFRLLRTLQEGWPRTSWHLLVQSQHWKHQNNVWNLYKVNNKDTRATSMMSFWCLYCLLWTDFTYSSEEC